MEYTYFLNHRWIVLFSICPVLQSFWRFFFAVWYSAHPGKVLQGRFCLLCVCCFICSGRAKVLLFHSLHLSSSSPPHSKRNLIPRCGFLWLLGCVHQCSLGFSSSHHWFHLILGVFFCVNTFWKVEMLLVSALLASYLSWVWFQKMGAGFLSTQMLSLKVCVSSRTKKFSGHFYLILLWSFLLQIQPLHNHGYRTAGFCQNLLPGTCSLKFPFSLGCFSSSRALLVSMTHSGKENPFCLFTKFYHTCKKLWLISLYFALCYIHVLYLII